MSVWQCPVCSAENPNSQPVCFKCDAQRVISGGGVAVLNVPVKVDIDAQQPVPE